MTTDTQPITELSQRLDELKKERGEIERVIRAAILDGGEGKKLAPLQARRDALPTLIRIAESDLLRSQILQWEGTELPALKLKAEAARQAAISARDATLKVQERANVAARGAANAHAARDACLARIRAAKERLLHLVAEEQPRETQLARMLKRM